MSCMAWHFTNVPSRSLHAVSCNCGSSNCAYGCMTKLPVTMLSLSLYSWSGTFYLFIYLGFYVAFNTVQVISRRVVGRAEETSTYSSSGFCTVNCRPTASNYQLSHLRPCRESNPGLRGGRRECYHSATVAPSGTFEFSA